MERDGGILVDFGKVGLNIFDEDSLHSANSKILLVKAKICKPELQASEFQATWSKELNTQGVVPAGE